MIFYRAFLLALLVAQLAAIGFAQAQQYRWIDKDGKLQFTDVPPPPGAKEVRQVSATTAKPAPAPLPFELAELQKNFPVTLYTAPAPVCVEPCALARGALNKRGVPFNEIQVWNDETLKQLKELGGSGNVPTLVVGRSVQSGYDSVNFDALLDSAGYPTAGALPARAQAAPPPPEGWSLPPVAEPVKPAPATAAGKPGPYDASGLTGPPPKPGQYDPSGLTGPPPKPGQYGIPAESK